MDKTDIYAEKLGLASRRYAALIARKFGKNAAVPPDDTCGWGGALCANVEAAGGSGSVNGFYVTGAAGSGRHNSAGFAVNALTERGFFPCFVKAGDFPEADSAALEGAVMKTLAATAGEDGKCLNLCVIADLTSCAEAAKRSPAIFGTLENILLNSLADSESPAVFVIIIADELYPMPSALRGELLLCRLSLPNATDRVNFINKNSHFPHTDDWTNELAALTEGMDYSELRDICRHITDICTDMDELPESAEIAEMLGFAPKNLPEPEEIPIPEPKLLLADKILERVDRVIDILPTVAEIFASRAPQTVVGQPYPVYNNAPANGQPDVRSVDIPAGGVLNENAGNVSDMGEYDVSKLSQLADAAELTQKIAEQEAGNLQNLTTCDLLGGFFSEKEQAEMRERGLKY